MKGISRGSISVEGRTISKLIGGGGGGGSTKKKKKVQNEKKIHARQLILKNIHAMP